MYVPRIGKGGGVIEVKDKKQKLDAHIQGISWAYMNWGAGMESINNLSCRGERTVEVPLPPLKKQTQA